MPYALASFRPAAVMLVPFALIIASAYQSDTASAHSPLAWKPLVVAGTWSYAFYLIHSTVIGVTRGLATGSLSNSYVVMTLAIVVAAIASGVAYRFCELPAQEHLKGLTQHLGRSA